MYHKWISKFQDSLFSVIPGENGFLPVENPLSKLPRQFNKLEEILQNMQIDKNGYLKYGQMKREVDKLPLYSVSDISDKALLAALFRDYCFLASAYSLEPCHLELEENKNNDYGFARDSLPIQISEPLIELSKKLGTFPWLDYAYGYGLNNAVLIDKLKPHDYNSYKTIRMFNGNASESGFINVHVAMVSYSGKLTKYQCDTLDAIHNNNRDQLNISLNNHAEVLRKIVETLSTMWKASKSKEYLSFRTFIMGQVNNNKCYKNETINYNLSNGITTQESWRGETGAQDSLVPSIDSLFGLKYPKNILTEYLYELRDYRPLDHQSYINYLSEMSLHLNFKEYCKKSPLTCYYVLKNLNYLRLFRKKHWILTKKYIIKNTSHPVATGGTPITTWLPNQLGATLEYMKEMVEQIDKEPNIKNILNENYERYVEIKIELNDHVHSLIDEVNLLSKNFSNQKIKEFNSSISKL